jgi:hypothetical protein
MANERALHAPSAIALMVELVSYTMHNSYSPVEGCLIETVLIQAGFTEALSR